MKAWYMHQFTTVFSNDSRSFIHLQHGEAAHRRMLDVDEDLEDVLAQAMCLYAVCSKRTLTVEGETTQR